MFAYRDPNKSPEERALDLLGRLTLREKVGQVCQRLYGFKSFHCHGEKIELDPVFMEEVQRFGGLGVLYGLYRADPWSGQTFETGLYGINCKRAYNIAQRYVLEHSRLGIPMLLSEECPHGHQALDGYLLPVNLAAGATWNPELLRKGFEVCASQLQELGADFSLMSMLDICRDPRWGRSEECYSEDPYLAASMADAAVRGCRKAGLLPVSKHFCAQGETTGGKNASAARIGTRELLEIHIPVAKAAVDAGTRGFMAAYNEIDGVFCHANHALLTDLLRDKLGFDGIVMADGCAIDRLNEITGDIVISGAMAMNAGVDIGLWDEAFSHLEESVEQGFLEEKRLDEAVLRVLKLKFERGLFEHPYLDETEPEFYSYDKYSESYAIAKESIVLLKNKDGILPLSQPLSLQKNAKRIAVIGPNAEDIYCQLGDYTPPQRKGVGSTVLEGLKHLYGDDISYSPGCTVCGTETSGFAAAMENARQSDVIILVLGGTSSRFSGARFDSNGAVIVDGPVQMDCGEGVDSVDLRLPGVQHALAEQIFSLGKPVITVIIGGRAYAIKDIAERSDALLYAFYPGPEGGRVLAEIISGMYAPSGRLPVTIPASVGCLPCSYNHKASYSMQEGSVLYPFGFGITYSEFVISDVCFPDALSVNVLREGTRYTISFRIQNTGSFDAFALPQLFVQHRTAPVVPRIKELKSFSKVLIPAGAQIECSLSIGAEELSMYDQNLNFDVFEGIVELILAESADEKARKRIPLHA